MLQVIFSNPILNVAMLSWLVAQMLKVLLNFVLHRKIKWERMVGAGGMPSSHSSFVCGMMVMTCRCVGYSSPLFAISFGFAVVVMYDAMGVRRAAGEQAKVLNEMTDGFQDLFMLLKEQMDARARGEATEALQEASDKKLKELLGHTPLEVLCGGILGTIIGLLMPIS